ncbi:4Fe-4S dicluster domain-containing protein [Candidatus Formimonas warabiya]|uniref:4Fe-4S ferredoxin n=1 Tax=Formimonas warabiya TaxID=1761012 RepID=A0A3G1KS56_FORW1|nr:4Fe-4S dicluster domain-containing protein [Candidatus Formimonas warabiya]ATW24975.1 4Fe-4S ferredoxin [Candidatus Formimonas warabiya]
MARLPIYIMGKRYDIPEGYTILKAFEYAGFKMIRGCGCRAGACGACATVYRLDGDHHLRVALACQTSIEAGMILSQIPFYPPQKKTYDLDRLTDFYGELIKLYPEVTRCMGCNACTKSCPQKIQVLDYIGASLRGDFETAAELSFDCLMCGICVSRCPAELTQYNIAMYVRRICGKFLGKKSDQLEKRTGEINAGIYTEEINRLKKMTPEELKQLYAQRDIVQKKF